MRTCVFDGVRRAKLIVIPSNDVCKNIEGTQSYVPSGMYTDASGNCLTTQNTTTQQSNQNNNNPSQTNTTPQVVVPPVTVVSPDASFVNSLGYSSIKTFTSKSNVKIGSFTIKNNSTEILQVNSFNVNLLTSGYPITDMSNVTLKSDNTTIGSPIANTSSGVLVFPLTNTSIPVNGSKTFDVYSDIGASLSGSVNVTAEIKYTGAVTNISKTLSATGAQITPDLMIKMMSTSDSFKPLLLGTNRGNIITKFTVSADSAGKVGLKSAVINLATVGISNPVFSSAWIETTTSGGSIYGSKVNISGSKMSITFGPDYAPIYDIEAGQTQTFTITASVSGDPQTGTTPYLNSSLGSSDSFVWIDKQNGNNLKDGSSIIGYPTNSYETSH